MDNTLERIRKVKNLIKEGKNDKARTICKKHFDNPKFISLYITTLMNENRNDEAKELCLKHLNHIPIASQYLTILIDEGDYEEARNICEKHPKKEELTAQYIKILLHFDEMDKIRKLGECYPYNVYICRQYVIALIHDKDYEKGIEICDRYMYDTDMLRLKKYALKKLQKSRKNSCNKRVSSDVSNSSDIFSKATILMLQKKYDEAKALCKTNMHDKRITDLYVSILEREKNEKGRKKYIHRNKKNKK